MLHLTKCMSRIKGNKMKKYKIKQVIYLNPTLFMLAEHFSIPQVVEELAVIARKLARKKECPKAFYEILDNCATDLRTELGG